MKEKKMRQRSTKTLRILLIVTIAALTAFVSFVGIKATQSFIARDHKPAKTETVDSSDKVYISADYDRKIFGPYRFNRGSSQGQYIYEQLNSDTDRDAQSVLVRGGKIEKYMHDGSRYIGYHMTERIVTGSIDGVEQYGDGKAYYGILDTQTKAIEIFSDIDALSKAIQKLDLRFGNWFYTAAGNSIEGIRTPLYEDYSYEYLNETRGQSILRREIPLFYGILQNVRTDGERYISFRQRTIRNAAATWYDDPVTNALLHAPSKKRIGLYRGGFLDWYSVYYDQYVLFDTRDYTVQEFKNERKLKKFCDSEKISLQVVEIRKQ